MDTSQKITHVLDRLTLGARPGDRTQLQRAGVDTYIQSQLNPPNNPKPASLARSLRGYATLSLSPVDLFEQYSPARNSSPEQREAARARQVQIVQAALQARVRGALESDYQLQEVMADFWFNHFNVFLGKGLTKLWVGVYEKDAIRPHALGKFRNLLGATAKHPAMSFYLDNWRNTDPNSRRARGPYQGLNENYARELMELHTMGVNGGYTQADVQSLTRILTGWGLGRTREASADGSGFTFEPVRHDGSDKTLLGQSIPGGGLDEGERALDLLAQHPSTARHISYKLAEYFVSDTPPEGLVSRLSDRFLATDGDIRAVLSSLFESDQFWDDAYFQVKFKTPYQYLISMVRATGLSEPDENTVRRIVGAMGQLGMPLYRCRTPDGYSQQESAWLNADAMLQRLNFARMAAGLDRENRPNAAALKETLGEAFSAQTLAVVDDSPAGMRPALLLGSPEMMYR
ncbi:MAG: DUF1800 domain-containing protein [Phormidesmis sp.]